MVQVAFLIYDCADLVAFLKRSQRALRKGSAIGVKEDMREDGEGGILGKRLDPVD